ncbi:MAG: hypothetical protein M0Z69_02870, partial [Actinomycetota bacterium]|nr:hypothetical protein [Actinomycetota bacterium]
DAAIFPSALGPAQVSALYGAGSQSNWEAELDADGAGYSWTLGGEPAPSSSYTLSSLSDITVPLVALPTPGASATYSFSISRDATDTVAAYPDAAGLHLVIPLSIEIADGGFGASLVWPDEDVIL